MKKTTIFFLTLYQVFFSPLLRALSGGSSGCRYNPTCSEYTKQMISQHGAARGLFLGTKRLLTCHPFTRSKNM